MGQKTGRLIVRRDFGATFLYAPPEKKRQSSDADDASSLLAFYANRRLGRPFGEDICRIYIFECVY